MWWTSKMPPAQTMPACSTRCCTASRGTSSMSTCGYCRLLRCAAFPCVPALCRCRMAASFWSLQIFLHSMLATLIIIIIICVRSQSCFSSTSIKTFQYSLSLRCHHQPYLGPVISQLSSALQGRVSQQQSNQPTSFLLYKEDLSMVQIRWRQY